MPDKDLDETIALINQAFTDMFKPGAFPPERLVREGTRGYVVEERCSPEDDRSRADRGFAPNEP